MGGSKGPAKPVTEAAVVLAANLNTLMTHAERHGRYELATPAAIEKATGGAVGKSTIYRLCNMEVRARLDNLVDIADAFGIPVWALLAPGLDPGSRPLAISEQELEVKVQRRAQQLVQAMMNELATTKDAEREAQKHSPPRSSPPHRETPDSGSDSGPEGFTFE